MGKSRLGDYIKEYSVKNKNDEDIPVYSVTNTQGFCKDYFGKEVASKDKTTYKIVPRGCFAYNPSRINVGSVDWQRNEDRVIVSPLYNVFSVSEELNLQYLYYYLKSDFALQRIRAVATGSVRDNLKLNMLYEFPINIPTIDEQNILVDKLDKARKIIELHQEELKLLDELVRGRFVELFGHPENNEMNWPQYCFGDICTVRQGLQIPISKRLTETEENCYEYITVAYLHGGKEREYIKDPKDSVICHEDDILMTRTGNTGMVVTDVEGVFHNNFFLIDFDRNRFSKGFLVEYLNLDYIQADILRRAGTSTIPDLNHGDFYKMKIYEPPIALQKEFEAFSRQIDKSKFGHLSMLTTMKSAYEQQTFIYP